MLNRRVETSLTEHPLRFSTLSLKMRRELIDPGHESVHGSIPSRLYRAAVAAPG
jgi:hypothetical protein